jgi:hypothetical protein
MTEATQRKATRDSDGEIPPAMISTETQERDGNNVEVSSKEHGEPPASSASTDGVVKSSSKKRRKVNHGQPHVRCYIIRQ